MRQRRLSIVSDNLYLRQISPLILLDFFATGPSHLKTPANTVLQAPELALCRNRRFLFKCLRWSRIDDDTLRLVID